MKKIVLWTLIALNAVLMAGFISRAVSDNSAIAQNPGAPGARRPGDYLLIPGEVTGGNSSVVYIIDTVNGELSAMVFDDSQRRLEVMPKIDMARDFESAARNPVNPRGR